MEMISGKTSLVGLLGQPVNHSLSPVIHNAAMQEMGLDWCYLAMPCESKNLNIVTKALLNLNCKGLNITIPHKQSALNICKTISPLAKKLGAVNTLIPNQEEGWTGDNTDVEGFLAPLKVKEWKGKKAIIIGCGGSARAVMAGLENLDIKDILVIGRNKNSLNCFLKDLTPQNLNLQKNKIHLEGLLSEDDQISNQIKKADLIINATPIGMSKENTQAGLSHEMPLGETIWQNLEAKTILYDLIYTPRPTAWLTLGAQKGCTPIDGLEMLIQQAAASLRLWSQTKDIPIDVMRAAAKKHLTS